MIRSFKYRLYPNKTQELALFNILNLCKDLYNGVLKERISYYNKYGKSLSHNAQMMDFFDAEKTEKKIQVSIASKVEIVSNLLPLLKFKDQNLKV